MQTTTKVLESSLGATFIRTVRASGTAESADVPLVVVPGGPGLPHNYLQGLGELARLGRPVVFYDPVGSGRSALDGNGSGTWDLAMLVDELGRVVDAVASDGRCFVLGHSSGGWVALEALVEDAALRARIAKLVLASAPLDVPAYLAAQAVLIDSSFGRRTRRLLRRPPPAGGRRQRAYLRSYQEYLQRFACRPPWPPELLESTARSNREAYEALWGPSEVWATGPLRTWSCEHRVEALTMPILLTSGRADEVTPALMAEAQKQLPTSVWRVFEHSAHMPHIEEPQPYLEAVDAFLTA